jgi:hypothetical protein
MAVVVEEVVVSVSEDRDYLYLLGAIEEVPPEDADINQPPKCRALIEIPKDSIQNCDS